MRLKKRVPQKWGEESVFAADKPGYANLCPPCSGPLPLSNEKRRQKYIRKYMVKVARQFGWSESEADKIIDEQWQEDYGIEPSGQNSK